MKYLPASCKGISSCNHFVCWGVLHSPVASKKLSVSLALLIVIFNDGCVVLCGYALFSLISTGGNEEYGD